MDYRLFPEPDLPALTITQEEIAKTRTSLPELPEARRVRFMAEFGVTEYEAGMLLQSHGFADFFEAVAKAVGDAWGGKQAANWMLGEVSRVLNDRRLGLDALGLNAKHLADLIGLVEARVINLNTAKDTVFPALLRREGDPKQIVERQGLAQISDRGAIATLVQGVFEAHPEQLARLKAGDVKLRGFFVGQVMKAGSGKANPQLVNEILEAALAE